MAAKKVRTIEENMKRLEEIGRRMSVPNINLEDSFTLYNEGINIVKDCQKQLSGIEKQIEILSTEGDIEEYIDE